jgi:Na+-transporting NADH:ubiquinone oxidoreductase subunit NqrB
MSRLPRPTLTLLAILVALSAAAVAVAVFIFRRRLHRNPAVAGTAALFFVWAAVHV